MIEVRLDPRLYGRVDVERLLQEVYRRAAAEFDEYCRSPTVSSFVWLRTITRELLLETHRRHLRSLDPESYDSTSYSIASGLLESLEEVRDDAWRIELLRTIKQALDAMDELSREVLALRHFEELDNRDVAQVLGISKRAASEKYLHALRRLRSVLEYLHRVAASSDNARSPG